MHYTGPAVGALLRWKNIDTGRRNLWIRPSKVIGLPSATLVSDCSTDVLGGSIMDSRKRQRFSL